MTKNSLQWIRDNPSDIKCLQEFYQDYTTPSRNAIQFLKDNGEFEISYQMTDGNPKKISHGLAILSKFPIINEGRVFNTDGNNGVMFVDLVANKDTIRVYNCHLESMSIQAEKLDHLQGIRNHYKSTLRKLKNGIEMRANQVRVLTEHVENSPYPVVIAGDFNDVPYSYTYFKLRNQLSNAFESAGRGFGFTYNRVLFFLRIDNIFYNEFFEAKYFKTHREVDYSDHYPISGIFQIKKEVPIPLE